MQIQRNIKKPLKKNDQLSGGEEKDQPSAISFQEERKECSAIGKRRSGHQVFGRNK
jgi:hypothetical protein